MATTAALTAPVALIAAYGCARAGTAVMSEVRNAVFAKVAQGAIRKVGRQVRLPYPPKNTLTHTSETSP